MNLIDDEEGEKKKEKEKKKGKNSTFRGGEGW